MFRKSSRVKNESCDDPRELLLSLVDLGSIDSDEMLLACVQEMSDAECKRVLNSLSLPACSDCVDSEPADDEMTIEFPEDDEDDWGDDEDSDDVEESDDEADEDADEESDDDSEEEAELEARIRKLERSLSNESRRRFRR